VPLDYILTPTQIGQLQLTAEQSGYFFHFDPRAIVRRTKAAIAAMQSERSGEAPPAEPPKRRHEDEEGKVEIRPTQRKKRA